MIEAYPLQWPIGRSRTPHGDKRYGQFKVSPVQIRRDMLKELSLMGVTSYVINSNSRLKGDGMPYVNQYIDDTGVVLYFTRKGKEIAIACDKYYHINDNLRAIGLSLAAIRGMERWGTEEMVDRAFTGFAALPENVIVTPYQKRPWYDVLEVSPNASREVVRAAYRQMLQQVASRPWRQRHVLPGGPGRMEGGGSMKISSRVQSDGTYNMNVKPEWQYHLQQMVIADDPITYLGEHL